MKYLILFSLLMIFCQPGYQYDASRRNWLFQRQFLNHRRQASATDIASLTPSLQPLQYVTPASIASYLFETTQNSIAGLLLPVDQQDALAIFISEGISGFLGGIAAKGENVLLLLDCP